MYACKSELYISLCCINSKLRQHIAWEALCCVEDAFWLQEHSLLANGKTWIALISVMWFVGVRESVLFQNYYYFNAVAGGFFISLHHHTKELEGKVKNNYFSLSWIFFSHSTVRVEELLMHVDGLFPLMSFPLSHYFGFACISPPQKANCSWSKQKFYVYYHITLPDSLTHSYLLICSACFAEDLLWSNSQFSSSQHRTIDHVICAFNLPTEYRALGQEHIIDEDDKVKIKVDPMKMSLDGITATQLEEIVDGWMKFITKAFRDASEKVSEVV